MKVLFVTAELRPLASAGGLGEAAAGLVAALGDFESQVSVVAALPDYGRWDLDDESTIDLDVPDWAAPASARIGVHPDVGPIALIDVPGIVRPDLYVDEDGEGWSDNDVRFAAFSAAAAALGLVLDVDLIHLNDWHSAFAPPFIDPSIKTMLTIHNLGHQGQSDRLWLDRLPTADVAADDDDDDGRVDVDWPGVYRWGDGSNWLAGAISGVDLVTTVSPTYAREVLTPAEGFGLDPRLAECEPGVVGIRNGIDSRMWNPETDPYTARFSAAAPDGKQQARAGLLETVGWDDTGDPLIVMVTRLVEQKGVDLAFEAARFLDGMRARLIVLGSGERRLADWGRWLMDQQPDRFWFYDGYDAPLSHQLFAGGDLLLMPSRFEPCGLAQMQAMAYGTIPIVTGVGGLADTVIDADAHSDGNGFVATTMDESGTVDALHRALRAHRHAGRRRALIRRGMSTDWSWREPAARYLELYAQLTGNAG